MPTILVPVEQKRPKDATPERAYQMFLANVKPKEIAQLWGISISRVYALISKGRWIENGKTTGPRLE